jgi:hypothetical protein
LVQNRMNRLVGQLLSFLSSRITLQWIRESKCREGKT